MSVAYGVARFVAHCVAGPALERTGQAIGNRIAKRIDPTYQPPEGRHKDDAEKKPEVVP